MLHETLALRDDLHQLFGGIVTQNTPGHDDVTVRTDPFQVTSDEGKVQIIIQNKSCRTLNGNIIINPVILFKTVNSFLQYFLVKCWWIWVR